MNMKRMVAIRSSFLSACLLISCSTEHRHGDFTVAGDFRSPKNVFVLCSPFFNVGKRGTYRFRIVDLPHPIFPDQIDFVATECTHNNQHSRDGLRIEIAITDQFGKVVAISDEIGYMQRNKIEYKKPGTTEELTGINLKNLPDTMRRYCVSVEVLHPSSCKGDKARLRRLYVGKMGCENERTQP